MFGFVDQDARAKNIIWEQKDHTGTSVFENNLVASLGLDWKVREQTGSPHSEDKHLLNIKRNQRKIQNDLEIKHGFFFIYIRVSRAHPLYLKASQGKQGSQIKDVDFLQMSVGHPRSGNVLTKWAEMQPVAFRSTSARPQAIDPPPLRTSGPDKLILRPFNFHWGETEMKRGIKLEEPENN